MTPNSRLLKNYDKICPICKGMFYNKNLRVKYCSKNCAALAYMNQQRIASRKWREKQKRLQNA